MGPCGTLSLSEGTDLKLALVYSGPMALFSRIKHFQGLW